MHPTDMAALTTERHAELLRTAEQHRRARLAGHAPLATTVGLALRARWRQLEALAPARRAPGACCA